MGIPASLASLAGRSIATTHHPKLALASGPKVMMSSQAQQKQALLNPLHRQLVCDQRPMQQARSGVWCVAGGCVADIANACSVRWWAPWGRGGGRLVVGAVQAFLLTQLA